jgi:hypothetical protein
VSQYDRLYALVQEIEATVAGARHAADLARRQVLRRPIPSGLGTVTVKGEEGLVSVDLDVHALRYTNGSSLGRALLTAITEAEAEWRTDYRQQVAGAGRRNRSGER